MIWPRAALFIATLAIARPAHADPQWNASALTGVCGTGDSGAIWRDTCWFNAIRADVLLGRTRNSDLGVGPLLELSTAGFSDVRLALGPTVLLPVHPYFPVMFQAGLRERHSELGWSPGLQGSVFVGSRSYNFHSYYGLSGGLVLTAQRGLDETHDTLVAIAVQVDVLLLAMPFIAGYSWLRGPPDPDS
jgi:hypothetical protein